jgi:Kdo2-lipid IVA lauroyltransferase/acyltransferase
LLYKFQILLIKIILFFFRILPEEFSYAFGKALGLTWFYIIRYRRNLVIDNLKKAYRNEKTNKEIYNIAKENFIHYGISFIEFLRFPLLRKEDLKKKLVTSGDELIDRALKKKKGLIVICGHCGNWDFMSIAQALLGYNAYVITRRAKSKSVDMYWQKIREEKGVRFLQDRNSIFSILKVLKKNEPVCIVIDQHMGGKMGVRVKFFNRPASTMRAIALIAKKTGCPVLPIYSWREKRTHFFKVYPEIDLVYGSSDEETIKLTTQAYNDSLEAFVRKHPSQWLWIHKRWKPE